MAERSYCRACHYPMVTCICDSIRSVACDSRIDVLQHPSETKVAKNTLRLAKLCIEHIQIWVGETDFSDLKESLLCEKRKVLIVYPGHNAIPAERLQATIVGATAGRYRLVFLDATWRKAYKIWHSNTWLWHFPTVVIEAQNTQYRIRKATKANSLSTLESIAYMIALLEDVNTQPLFNCLEKMQQNFHALSPKR